MLLTAGEAAEIGLEVRGSCVSPITGAKKGNVELFLHLATPDEPSPRAPDVG